ncbi:MAG TPA: site-2 protease family protein [Thermodesulfobacteriota bacterium]|jgi:membrane-associated protease RseP (regulator of RpoE activity)|nr:site-2 protease family protein [Thermodesulfobacteriota bacterium]
MRRYTLHILLFILTVASTCFVGGPVYSFAVILILFGHEMGHYLMSRRYGIRATLPFFLPFPLPPFGTLGAVIRMESTVSSRKALFDTGVAGPLTSLILSIPAIVIGLKLSTVVPTSHIKEGALRLADPLLFSSIQRLVLGQISENYEIVLHPIGFAGWVGLFVTSLNLLPIGQLDGGHIAYGLFGRRSRVIFLVAIAVMAFITVFYNPGWFLLLILIILFGFRHPPPMDDQTPLGWKRKLLGGFVFLAFFVSFTPAPFPEYVEDIKQLFHWF